MFSHLCEIIEDSMRDSGRPRWNLSLETYGGQMAGWFVFVCGFDASTFVRTKELGHHSSHFVAVRPFVPTTTRIRHCWRSFCCCSEILKQAKQLEKHTNNSSFDWYSFNILASNVDCTLLTPGSPFKLSFLSIPFSQVFLFYKLSSLSTPPSQLSLTSMQFSLLHVWWITQLFL